MKRFSLRWMILVPVLLVIFGGFGGFGLYADGVNHRSRIADVDEELRRAAAGQSRIVESVESEQSPDSSSGQTGTTEPDEQGLEAFTPPVQLRVTSAGKVVAVGGAANPFDQTTIAELAQVRGFRTVSNPRYRVLVRPRDDGRIAITALPLDGVDEAISDFHRALGIGGAVVIALQGLVVWVVTSRLVRPVARMSRTATLVADGALDTEVGPPSGSRETAALAVDLGRMLARLRSTLAESEQSAADAVQARDNMQRFLADVSHEIRTPLTALRGYSDLYARGMLDEPGAVDRAMRRVGDESDRLQGLVSNMLQLARNGAAAARFEVFDVASVVADVVSDLRSANPDRVIELGTGGSLEHLILGSPSEVHQAVLNLGSNACNHTVLTSTVEVTVQSRTTDVTIQVVDHGSGIDPLFAESIFLPFFRVDSSRTRGAGGGAGLGLALTKQIADHHRGTVTVDTTPGGGATFRLTLPRYFGKS